MSDRYDAISFKKTKSGKTFAVRLGSAVPRDDGGFNIYLDAIPAPEDGQYKLTITRPRGQDQSRQAAPAGNDLDDTIPY